MRARKRLDPDIIIVAARQQAPALHQKLMTVGIEFQKLFSATAYNIRGAFAHSQARLDKLSEPYVQELQSQPLATLSELTKLNDFIQGSNPTWTEQGFSGLRLNVQLSPSAAAALAQSLVDSAKALPEDEKGKVVRALSQLHELVEDRAVSFSDPTSGGFIAETQVMKEARIFEPILKALPDRFQSLAAELGLPGSKGFVFNPDDICFGVTG